MNKISLTQPASEADLAARALDMCPVCGDTAGWCPGPTSDVGCHTWRPTGPPIDGPDDQWWDGEE